MRSGGLGRFEAAPDRGDDRGVGLHALVGERSLQIGREPAAKRVVIRGATDEVVDAAPRPRQLLRSADPRLGSRWKRAQERGELCLVETAHDR